MRERGLVAEVVEADVRRLELLGGYDWAFIGFHAVAELVEERDRLDALRSIARVLVKGGAFSCSLHNPAVRGPQLDGRWLVFSPIAIPTTEADRQREQAGSGSGGERADDEIEEFLTEPLRRAEEARAGSTRPATRSLHTQRCRLR